MDVPGDHNPEVLAVVVSMRFLPGSRLPLTNEMGQVVSQACKAGLATSRKPTSVDDIRKYVDTGVINDAKPFHGLLHEGRGAWEKLRIVELTDAGKALAEKLLG